jgi:hypothetical protein
MRYRFLMAMGVGAALLAGASLALMSALGSGPTIAAQSNEGEGTWTAPRTPWGTPDMTGIWGLGYVFTPLERPKQFADREFLTEEEVVALERAHAEPLGDGTGGRPRGERGSVADVEGAYNQAFSQAGQHERVVRTKRTSLIVDPPDGRIPFTPEGRKRMEINSQRTGDEETQGADGSVSVARTSADGPEDRGPDRCIGVVVPFVKRAGSFHRIVQGPRSVGIFMEDGLKGTAYRVIPLDGRPHLPAHFRTWLGHSVGRWEGETLVVDTTNFTDKSGFQGASEQLHLVERFTRVAADLLMYRVTLEDPIAYTRPWTMELPLTLADNFKNQIYEGACHEGNYSLATILAGARLLEKKSAVFTRRKR